MQKKKFSPVEANPNFVAQEHHWLSYWEEKKVLEKYLKKNQHSSRRFSFFDGPITANNPMGIHHAWGRTYKDLFQRYKNMQGFAQRFQNGFDNQGLWVEVEVEKKLGFKTKKEIEAYGIDKFIEACKNHTLHFAQIQTEQSKRLGYFMDWDHSYYTMSEENNYTIWHFLKKCHEDGLIYKGEDAVPWCPRCGTAISQHEIVTEGYKEITHEAVYFRLPVVKKGRLVKDEFFLVWTTTPWTIPANTLLAINPDFDYVLLLFEGKKYWLGKKLAGKIFPSGKYEILKEIKGKDLLKKEKITHYQAPFDFLPILEKVKKSPHFHEVVFAPDLVTEEEGTGVVHIVPGAGTEDYHLVKRALQYGEVIFPVINEEASYLEGYGELSGKNAKDNPQIIIEKLKEIDDGLYFFATENYRHQYPVCWRCETELVWRLVNEWYIAMDKPRPADGKTLRQRMMAVAKKINWIPGFGLERELDWLNNMHDWLISKKRYWGLALPIWECPKCGHFEVIGSREELFKNAVEGFEEFAGHTPHRPWIDKVKIPCPVCGEKAGRIADVGNPWLDAGIIAFSTLIDPQSGKVSYLKDKTYWRQWYPADLILECFPGQYRNWFYSLIAMSTELEDSPPTKTIFGHGLVRDEKGEEMHKSKGNAIWFDEAAEKIGVDVMRWMYLQQPPQRNLNFGYHLAQKTRRQFHLFFWNIYRFFITYAILADFSPQGKRSEYELDRWILSRLHHLIGKVSANLDRYQPYQASGLIQDFIKNDLSLWYIRRSRSRLEPANEDKKDRQACLETLYEVLLTLSKILAPFLPFLAEEVYQNLKEGLSVHLEDWPKKEKSLLDQELEKKMAWVREVCNQGHRLRKEAGIKVRQPLAAVHLQGGGVESLEENLSRLIKEELNVKEVVLEKGGEELKVKLDTRMTPLLKKEGEARELIRLLQTARQKASLSPGQPIEATLPSWPKEFAEEIKKKTGARVLKEGEEIVIKPL